MPAHVCVACSCFGTTAELSGHNRDPTAAMPKIPTVWAALSEETFAEPDPDLKEQEVNSSESRGGNRI